MINSLPVCLSLFPDISIELIDEISQVDDVDIFWRICTYHIRHKFFNRLRPILNVFISHSSKWKVFQKPHFLKRSLCIYICVSTHIKIKQIIDGIDLEIQFKLVDSSSKVKIKREIKMHPDDFLVKWVADP